MIPAVIPTTPARRERSCAALVAQLSEHDWLTPIVSEHTEIREDVCRAVRAGLAAEPDAEWLLYCEDDIYLGPDFGRVPGVLAAAGPGFGGVTFWSHMTLMSGLVQVHAGNLMGSQCVAFRTSAFTDGLEAAVVETQDSREGTGHLCAADMLLGRWLARNRLRVLIHFPSLVQHRHIPSSVDPVALLPDRQSPSFAWVYGAIPPTAAMSGEGSTSPDKHQRSRHG